MVIHGISDDTFEDARTLIMWHEQENSSDSSFFSVHATKCKQEAMMLKYVAGLSMLLALGSLSTQTFAGPSHRVRCADPGRGTELLFHDAKPNQAFFEVKGRHNQLPKSSSSFVVNTAGVASPKVTNYKPYEVELTLENPAQIVTQGDNPKEIGILEKVILENHAELKIDVSDRPAAAILVLSSGLQLRFNGCRIDGGTAVMDWERTFGTYSSN